jgi:hypothetical protein
MTMHTSLSSNAGAYPISPSPSKRRVAAHDENGSPSWSTTTLLQPKETRSQSPAKPTKDFGTAFATLQKNYGFVSAPVMPVSEHIPRTGTSLMMTPCRLI